MVSHPQWDGLLHMLEISLAARQKDVKESLQELDKTVSQMKLSEAIHSFLIWFVLVSVSAGVTVLLWNI